MPTMIAKPTFALLALLMLVVTSPAALAADSYPIKLDRDYEAGDTFRRMGNITTSQSLSMNGQPMPMPMGGGSGPISFDITGEVKDVDSEGGIEEIVWTIRRVARQTGKANTAVLPAGSQVRIYTDEAGQTQWELNGEPMEMTGPRGQLEAVMGIERSLDAIFGASEEKSVGDTWSINKEEAAKVIKGFGIEAEQNKLDGQTTLTSVKDIRGAKAMTLDATLIAKDVAIPEDAMPGGAQLENATINAVVKTTAVYPVDTSKHIMELTTNSQYEANVTAAAGQSGATFNVKMTTDANFKQMPAK